MSDQDVPYAGMIVADVSGVCLKCGKEEKLGRAPVTSVKWLRCKAALVKRGWRQVGAWGMACPECAPCNARKGIEERKRVA